MCTRSSQSCAAYRWSIKCGWPPWSSRFVRTSQPLSVTSRVCSNCADRRPSCVTDVQLSGHIWSRHDPGNTTPHDAHRMNSRTHTLTELLTTKTYHSGQNQKFMKTNHLCRLSFQLQLTAKNGLTNTFKQRQRWQFNLCTIHTDKLATAVSHQRSLSAHIHCVRKKTPTHVFFHISMNDVWI